MRNASHSYNAYVRRAYCICDHHLSIHDPRGHCTATVADGTSGPKQCPCKKPTPLMEGDPHAPR
jgi:hypothetical protein